MPKWIYFEHKETGGTFEAPDEDGVRARYEALGWTEVDRPEDKPFVPAGGNEPAGQDTTWVTLYHPKANATHEFPNNADALSGAMESGWQYPKKATPDKEPENTPEPVKPAKKVSAPAKTTSEKES